MNFDGLIVLGLCMALAALITLSVFPRRKRGR